MVVGTNSVFGRDRPERGSSLHVVLDGVPLLSTAGSSSEAELEAEVPVTRTGRRPRLALGAELQVSWGWRDKVRTRPYRVADVVSTVSGHPSWRLVPLAPSAEGTRRAVPRHTIALPAVLVLADARWSGETVDLSVAGVRLAFPPVTTAQPGDLPEPGTSGELALLLDDERVAVPVSVVRASVLPDGTRDVRVFVTGDLDEHRVKLRDFVQAAAPAETPADLPADQPAQSKEEPVSAS